MRFASSGTLATVAALLGFGHACLVEIRDPVLSDGGSATTSAGGMGGTGGGDAGGTPNPPCPDDMVHISDANYPDVSFCIDRTEVTNARYVAFLIDVDDDVTNTDQPAECAFNQALRRGGAGSNCPTFNDANDLPVSCVDWCDAHAFCAWDGKRLCGAIGGGPLTFDAALTSDEWHFACSAAFSQTYPYGNDPQLCACYIPEEWSVEMACDSSGITNFNHKAPVASHPGCEGGFPGIFDMQGNASEWTNRCQPGTGDGEERCVTRGGHTFSNAGSSYYRCQLLDQDLKRNDAAVDPGIRCCRDAAPP